MVGVAQLVRAPGCGPGGRGFKSHHSPKHYSGYSVVRLTRLLWEREIGSSNLSTPTQTKPYIVIDMGFFVYKRDIIPNRQPDKDGGRVIDIRWTHIVE